MWGSSVANQTAEYKHLSGLRIGCAAAALAQLFGLSAEGMFRVFGVSGAHHQGLAWQRLEMPT
jgi:hypothetical protein